MLGPSSSSILCRPPCRLPLRVIIIGGGASGVLLASHCLRESGPGLAVTLIERGGELARGFAYSTRDPYHLLNVRAENMSAFADDPAHFLRWLGAQGHACGADPFSFVPRHIYGSYIGSLIEPHPATNANSDRLMIISGEAVAVDSAPDQVGVRLASGAHHIGDVVVLATGFDPSTNARTASESPWPNPTERHIAPADPILVLGTGLSMVDCVLSLLHRGHSGPITALSRRGLLPQTHCRTEALLIEKGELPLGKELSILWRWLRKGAEDHIGAGRDWRSLIDAIRPHSWELWQSLPHDSKHRFLRHARPWWDIHRHRMAPEVGREVKAALRSGRLRIIAAKVVSIELGKVSSTVSYRRRGSSRIETLAAAQVIPCTGVDSDLRHTHNPILRSVLDQRLARPDALSLGLDVTTDCAVIDGKGGASQRLYAIGPLTRGTFWESIAIPDIRVQCAQLVRHLMKSWSPSTG